MSESTLGNVVATESKFTWAIPNFSTIKADVGKPIFSPTFCTTYHCQESSTKVSNLHWRIQLYPSGGYIEPYHKDYISVCLANLDDIEVSTNYSIALIDELSDEIFFQCSSNNGRIFGENKKSWGWSNFAAKGSITDRNNGCLVNDTLTVSCRLYSTSVIDADQNSDEEDCSEASLNHFSMLFNTGNFSDMTINVGSQELRVHKSIVTSLSPVFRAMFDNQMKEKNENVVDIVDVEFDIIKEMLRYVYARKVYGIENIASDLFVAADKYCVIGLKRLCKKSLCKNLSEQNALPRLEMAVQYNMKRLKQDATKFIVKHLKNFNARTEFKELSSECKSELISNIAENHSRSFLRVVSCDDQKSDEEDCSESLTNHFDMLFNTGKFSDVTISVKSQKLHVHKNIVSFLSPVFQAMFENEMKEQNENVLEIVDFEFDTVKEMFRYMYTKKVNGIEKIASDLFVAADKYSVKGLQKYCEKSLCANLDAHNAVQRLEIAVQYNMKKVKKDSIIFIVEDLKIFGDKPEFKALSSECKSELLSYIAEVIAFEHCSLIGISN